MSAQKSLGSDNHSGIHPAILEAIIQANQGTVHAYGDDAYTERAVQKFRDLFGQSVEVFFVFNGTAANVLGLQALNRPHEAILCAATAHINNDECGAPEAMTGCKIISLPHHEGKLTEESLAVAREIIAANGAPHRVKPRTLAISQSTEFGTVYTPEEIKTLSPFCKQHKLYLHMDGARIANAVASLGVSVKDLTINAGVDVLSFGGTKNGIMGAEAVVFFNPQLAQEFQYLRKQNMQLASKMRFISAQFEALLHNDLWIKNALHANRMAQLLAKEAAEVKGVTLTRSVQANAVFAKLPGDLITKIQSGCYFYVWDHTIPEVRWMTSFDTTAADIKAFIDLLKRTIPQ